MESNDKNDNNIFGQIILWLIVLIGTTFINKKLHEHGKRLPTLVELLIVMFWIGIIGLIIMVIGEFFYYSIELIYYYIKSGNFLHSLEKVIEKIKDYNT